MDTLTRRVDPRERQGPVDVRRHFLVQRRRRT